MKLDPYKYKEQWQKWKDKSKDGIKGLTPKNSEIILKYSNDMESGLNVATGSLKGSRSYIRLISLKNKLTFFSKKLRELYGVDDITKVTEEQIMTLFSNMRNGTIKREDGREYISVCTYVKNFKAFWHWHMKVSRKQGIDVPDITIDLDTSQEKPKWVYLNEEQVKTLCENAKYEYKVLFTFLFDTGIRAPTELMNVRISDLFNDCKEVQIREETSKTFGRRIKLMLCSEIIKKFVKEQKLNGNDYLFQISYEVAGRYLKRLAKRLFGDELSEAGQKYSEMSLYDFRHISCCYWLPRYKSESALKYRFGWKESDKIHYYSELLGMTDTISEDDMLVDVTRTEIEKRLEKSEREKEIMQEKVKVMEEQMKKIMELTTKLDEKIRK
jgi:integrase